jgi:hypothetical protein
VTDTPLQQLPRINVKSVLIAGGIAGVVMNLIDIAANFVIVDNGLRQRLDQINPALWAQMNAPGRLLQYILIDFVFAIALVWLYAAIRPQFGAGPKAALVAASYGWALYTVTQLLFVMMGLFTIKYVAGNAILTFVNYAATALVGAKFYKEGSQAGSTWGARD